MNLVELHSSPISSQTTRRQFQAILQKQIFHLTVIGVRGGVHVPSRHTPQAMAPRAGRATSRQAENRPPGINGIPSDEQFKVSHKSHP